MSEGDLCLKGLYGFKHVASPERLSTPLMKQDGRKNHLFAGSDGGGSRWAVLCSLIETCKLNGVEPYAYLKDVLERIVDGHPVNRLDELLPWV